MHTPKHTPRNSNCEQVCISLYMFMVYSSSIIASLVWYITVPATVQTISYSPVRLWQKFTHEELFLHSLEQFHTTVQWDTLYIAPTLPVQSFNSVQKIHFFNTKLQFIHLALGMIQIHVSWRNTGQTCHDKNQPVELQAPLAVVAMNNAILVDTLTRHHHWSSPNPRFATGEAHNKTEQVTSSKERVCLSLSLPNTFQHWRGGVGGQFN